MIGLTTLSLLAACPHAAGGAPAAPAPAATPDAAAARRGPDAAQNPPASSTAGTSAAPRQDPTPLPERAGPWVRSGTARRVTEDTIFDYMDGAGELYLAYRFLHLDVYEYAAPDASLGTIGVELYWMQGSDDAFGLLSTDWGGEPVVLRGEGGTPVGPVDAGGPAGGAPADRARAAGSPFPPHDALYGGGLLRFWSGNLYGRIMATRESPEARARVLAIARAVVEGRPAGRAAPVILSGVPVNVREGYALRPDRTCFFRSHYVLNSVYYLAPDDILGLGHDVDAVVSEHRLVGASGPATRLVQIAYPSSGAAASALKTFLRGFLPEHAPPSARDERAGAPALADAAKAGAAKSEAGWAGWAAGDRFLSIVLDAPTEADAKTMASAALQAVARR